MIVRDYKEVEQKQSEDAQGVTLRWVISKEDGAPHFAMRVIEVQKGCATPFHTHQWEHEVFVLAGKGVVKGKEGERPIGVGAVVFVPANESHQFVNTGDGELRFICLIPHT